MPLSDDELGALIQLEISAEDLAKLPDDMKVLWAKQGEVFVAIPELEEALTAAEAKRVAELAAKDQEIALLDAKISELRTYRHSVITEKLIGDLLIARGCKPGLLKAASATFRIENQLHIEDRNDGSVDISVAGPDGHIDLNHAFDLWAETDDGRALLPQPQRGS